MKIWINTICYGKTMKSIAEDLHKTEQEAQEIYDAVMTNIKGLKHLMEDSEEFARVHGYVEDKWGRRRHIPDMQLEPYVLTSKGNANFDPFFDSAEIGMINDEDRVKQALIQELKEAKWRSQKDKVKAKIEKEGFTLKENTKKIEDATRQCVNCVDNETEILTKEGWKNQADLLLTDEVLTMNPETCLMEWNRVEAVNRYEGEFTVTEFKHPSFSAVSTLNHRWFVWDKKLNKPKFVMTENLSLWGDHRIFRCGNNTFKENVDYSDAFIKLIGIFLTDGGIRKASNTQIELYQSVSVHPKQTAFIENVLQELNIPFGTSLAKDNYKTWIISYETGKLLRALFPERKLTTAFINGLSQRQANLLIDVMTMFDGHNDKRKGHQYLGIICTTKKEADMFQYLCQIAGKSSTLFEIDKRGHRSYGNVRNKCGYIETKSIYYIVRIQARTKIHVYKHHVFNKTVDFVWCPTVKNGTWVARRNGKTFITGNSRIQGSAATQSKIAIRLIGTHERLKKLGFKMAILVHDEILAECPYVTMREAEKLFTQGMLDSSKDLRTGAACDATAALCWYGDDIPMEEITVENLKKLKEEYYGFKVN